MELWRAGAEFMSAGASDIARQFLSKERRQFLTSKTSHLLDR